MTHSKAPCLNKLVPVPPPLCSRDTREGMRAILTNTEASVTALCSVSSQTAKSSSRKNLTSVLEVLFPYKVLRRAAE